MELVWISNIQLVLFKLSEKKTENHTRENLRIKNYWVVTLKFIWFQVYLLFSSK